TFSFTSSFPSRSLILALTSPSLSRVYSQMTTSTLLSPWGEIFITFLSENSIFASPYLDVQTPDREGLSLLSSADADGPARMKKLHASSTPHERVFTRIIVDGPLVRLRPLHT